MLIFNKRKYKSDYKTYLFYLIDLNVNSIGENKSDLNSEFIFDDLKKNLILFQSGFGSIKDYLIHKYGKKQYKTQYFLYNDIGDYLNLLFKNEFINRNLY